MPDEDPVRWSLETILIHIRVVQEETEKRTSERFAAVDQRTSERFLAQERATSVALSAQKEAVILAEKNAEKWRDAANEWRQAMNDRESKFVMKAEFEALAKSVDELRLSMNRETGRDTGLKAGWGYLVAAIAMVAAIVGVVVGIMAAIASLH